MDKSYEVISKLKRLVIKHPQYVAAFDQIVSSYTLNKEIEFQQNLICIGISGTGKSTLKRKLVDTYPPFDMADRRIVPVLVVDTPSLPTVKNVAETVLLTLGDPKYNKGSAVEKTHRILHFIRQCEVKLIVFDELQHFIDQGNKSAPRQVSDWLKTLIDQSGVSTVLMGLEQSEQILSINEQLRRRFSRRVDLKPFSIDTEECYWVFYRTIECLIQALGMQDTLALSDDLVRRFHYATNGIIGYMVTLVISAYQVAWREEKAGLSLPCLELAFVESIWASAANRKNPFNKEFVFERLDKSGMPFHRAGGKQKGSSS